jgi:hypothetical protein
MRLLTVALLLLAVTEVAAAQQQTWHIDECMVRRVNAREKFRMKKSLRKCIRPVGGELSPGHDEIRREPVLQNASAA